MRGRIVAVKGARVETLHVGEDAAWALDGDRGVTFAARIPQGARISEGEWWDADTKAPLVSLEAKVAKGLGLASATRSRSMFSAAKSPRASPICGASNGAATPLIS